MGAQVSADLTRKELTDVFSVLPTPVGGRAGSGRGSHWEVVPSSELRRASDGQSCPTVDSDAREVVTSLLLEECEDAPIKSTKEQTPALCWDRLDCSRGLRDVTPRRGW